jgi:pyruvate dehydrogenase E2 component (dihydrolipoamide acetyltransferase)
MVVEFKLPDLGEGLHEAEILDIRVKEGELVKADQILFEVETDKAAIEVPSPYEGVVQKIFVKVGEVAKVGKTIITFDQSGSQSVTQERAKPENVPAAIPVGARETAGAKTLPAASGNGKSMPAAASSGAPAMRATPASGPVPATPATRKLARDLNIDLRSIQGSGPAGRVTKEDVRAFAEGVPSSMKQSGAAATGSSSGTASTGRPQQQSIAARYGAGETAAPGGPLTLQPFELPDFNKYGQTERVPLRSLRKKIALNMTQAWTHVPHVTTFDEADITDLEAVRIKYEKTVAKAGGKLTLTVVAIKAVAAALKKYPQFNCSLDETTSEIVFKHFFNLGVAVATDRGLIVPVIRNADQKSLVDISIELAEIAQKTRDGKVEVDRLQGGTFTITNIGPIGGTGSCPMVNYPEVAILGMARSAEKPVVRNGQIVIRNILPLSLSFDHRVADGAEAAMFLRHICASLEDPFHLLLEV